MSGLIAGLAGAPGAASNAGSYYQNAMQNEINATGSPAAQQFGAMEQQALQPRFNQQDQLLADKEASMGITNSGAAKSDYGALGADQAATLAGAISPLYGQAMGTYGQIDANMPGAQNSAYQNAISNFYTGISDLGSLAAGVPPGASSGNPYASATPYDPYAASSLSGASSFGYG